MYKIDDVINKIICGDCLEIMKDIPDKSIDLVLTDPPYGINVGKPVERERERVILRPLELKGAARPKFIRGLMTHEPRQKKSLRK